MLDIIPDIIKVPIITFIFYICGEPGEIFDWYQKLIFHLPEYLWKPLGGCIKCVTGQVCFWFYLYKNYQDYHLFQGGIINHLFFVSTGMLINIILNYLYEKIKTN